MTSKKSAGAPAPTSVIDATARFNPDEPEWAGAALDPRSIDAHLRERKKEGKIQQQIPATPVDALKPDGGVGLPRGSLLPGLGKGLLDEADVEDKREIAMENLDGIFDPYFHSSARSRGRGRPRNTTNGVEYTAAPSAAAYPSYYDAKGERIQLKRLTHRHLSIMDYMLANPRLTLGELALYFGVTPAWLSTVRNSDLFRARMHERRRDMEQEAAMGINTRMVDMANSWITELEEALKDEEIDVCIKLDTTKMALEAIGFLGKWKDQAGSAQGSACNVPHQRAEQHGHP